MSSRIHYSQCPVCEAGDIHPVLTARDYTVSGEDFEIWECSGCHFRFTQDIPGADDISPYYKSESYISHTNTGKGLVNRIYRVVRTHTLLKKRRLVEKQTGLKKGSLLDIGSGTGSFVREMSKTGWEVIGLEPDPDARRVAREQHDIGLQEISAFFSLPPGSMDCISLWHVLEHVHELHRYMQQMKHLLKPGGRILVAVPNFTSWDSKHYGKFWAAWDVPRHLYHFSPGSMEQLLAKNGLRLISVKPMWYDSFYISMLSSRYRNGKINWLSSLWNGFRSNLKALGDSRRCSSVIYIIGK